MHLTAAWTLTTQRFCRLLACSWRSIFCAGMRCVFVVRAEACAGGSARRPWSFTPIDSRWMMSSDVASLSSPTRSPARSPLGARSPVEISCTSTTTTVVSGDDRRHFEWKTAPGPLVSGPADEQPIGVGSTPPTSAVAVSSLKYRCPRCLYVYTYGGP